MSKDEITPESNLSPGVKVTNRHGMVGIVQRVATDGDEVLVRYPMARVWEHRQDIEVTE